MASGVAHRRATIAAAIPVALITLHATNGCKEFAILAGVGCLCGIPLSPDLDVDSKTEAEKTFWRAGTLPGYAYQLLWYPYALALPHRHPLSHLPIIGTLGRLAYIQAWIWLARIHARGILGLDFNPLFWLREPLYTAAWVFGLMVSDALHWLMDGAPTGKKRKRPRIVWQSDKHALVHAFGNSVRAIHSLSARCE